MKPEGRTALTPQRMMVDDGRVSVRMRMCVCVWVGGTREHLFCFCLVFNFPTRIPKFPSGSLCHEWELTMNVDMVEQRVRLVLNPEAKGRS
jgi:hypothetical protein